jgi:hypothetical protein
MMARKTFPNLVMELEIEHFSRVENPLFSDTQKPGGLIS